MSFPNKHHFSDSRLKRSFSRQLFSKIMEAHDKYNDFNKDADALIHEICLLKVNRTPELTKLIWELQETVKKHTKAVYPPKKAKTLIKKTLSKRINGRCEFCLKSVEYPHKSHIIEKPNKNKNNIFYIDHPTNLIMLCNDCHIKLDNQKFNKRQINKLNRKIIRHNKKILKDVKRDIVFIRRHQTKLDRIRKNYKSVISASLSNFIRRSLR